MALVAAVSWITTGACQPPCQPPPQPAPAQTVREACQPCEYTERCLLSDSMCWLADTGSAPVVSHAAHERALLASLARAPAAQAAAGDEGQARVNEDVELLRQAAGGLLFRRASEMRRECDAVERSMPRVAAAKAGKVARRERELREAKQALGRERERERRGEKNSGVVTRLRELVRDASVSLAEARAEDGLVSLVPVARVVLKAGQLLASARAQMWEAARTSVSAMKERAAGVEQVARSMFERVSALGREAAVAVGGQGGGTAATVVVVEQVNGTHVMVELKAHGAVADASVRAGLADVAGPKGDAAAEAAAWGELVHSRGVVEVQVLRAGRTGGGAAEREVGRMVALFGAGSSGLIECGAECEQVRSVRVASGERRREMAMQ